MNPIIQRELIGFLRQPRAVAMQLAFIIGLAVLVLAVWPDSAEVNLAGRQAQQLFAVFMYGLLVALMLLAPAMPAMAIVRERQQRTLMLLLTSPLTPTSILIGKVSGALGFIALLLVLSLPAAAACYVMGGVSATQLLSGYGVLTLAAVQYALIALLVSATVKSTDAALRVTYGMVLLLSIIVLGPWYLLQGKGYGPIEDLAAWIASLSPIPAIMQVLDQGSIGTRGLQTDIDPIRQYAILAGVIAVICIAGLLRKLQSHTLDRPRSKGKVTDEMSSGSRAMRRVVFLWFFDPHKRTGMIADYENPVMMKEFRTRTFGRAHWMVRLIGVCLIVSVGLMILTTQGSMLLGGGANTGQPAIDLNYMGGLLVVFQMGLIILVTPALSAALISSELEGGGWVLMQVTALSPRNIVTGKLLSVLWTLSLILAATLPGYLILLEIDAGKTQSVINVLISLSLTAVFALLLGAACSACFRRTATATSWAYAILVGLTVVTLLPWLGEGTLFGHDVVEAFLLINPLAAALQEMRFPGMANYDLTPGNWIFLGIASAVCMTILWVRVRQLSKPQ